jgi:hypothetical protein
MHTPSIIAVQPSTATPPDAAIPRGIENHTGANSFSRVLARQTETAQSSASETPGTAADRQKNPAPLLKLGTLDRSTSTVSELLIRHPEFGRDCWKIIHSPANQNKAYTRIPVNTDIFLNTHSMELVWHDDPPAQTVSRSQSVATMSPPAGAGPIGDAPLLAAVEPFMGSSYDQMNCYELLVNGLQGMGYQYHGRGGLQESLIQAARQQGLAANAYLTGEGLVDKSGTVLFRNSYTDIDDPTGQARALLSEMAPVLEKGAILSFSTPTRGHTGIVSRQHDDWTYINSGVLDNLLHPGTDDRPLAKGVGEETLLDEVENWFKLARRQGEPLMVTIGRFDTTKLAAYHTGQPRRVDGVS